MARNHQQVLEQMMGAQQVGMAAMVAKAEEHEELIAAKDKRIAELEEQLKALEDAKSTRRRPTLVAGAQGS